MFEHDGGKLGVLDTSVPFGGINFTSAAVVAKQQHVNALFPTMIDASDFALTQSLEQAGVKLERGSVRHGLCTGRSQLSYVELLAG